jgi:site-specific recombinase XerC
LPFGPVTVAKAYRLLHAIMTTAVEDGLIRRNPCNIKGAGQEHSDERPVVPISTLVELLDNVPERYRALLLLGTFANLRFGELAGLRRGQLDLDAGEVHVNASTREMDDGRLIDGDPKSRAGTRTVAFPADIVPELADHLERFADPKPNGFVFIGPKGGRLRRSNFRDVWYRARGAVGLSELHFHDLRHTGNTMAAAQGASLKELMERIGHSSPRRAHLPARHPERDQKIAAGMGKLFVAAKKAQKSVGPKGAVGASGGSPSSARRLCTVASGTVTPKSQVSSSCPTRMYTVPSRSFHQTGALAQVPTLSVRRRSQSVFSMSASFQSSSVVAQMFSSQASLCSLTRPG